MNSASPNVDVVAIVPARAGSKRLPGKNFMDLHGKPLVRWTLEAALESQVIDSLVVSSDDDVILSEGARLGLYTIRRPEHLASDTATTFDVIVHTLECLAQEGVRPARVMLLQATSPLRRAQDIREAVQCMNDTKAASVVSVCQCEHSPLWSNTLGPEGGMDNFLRSELIGKRSQDLDVYYRLNGAIYIANTEEFIEAKGFFMPNSRAYIMPADRSVDIDTLMDFKLCEFFLAGCDK